MTPRLASLLLLLCLASAAGAEAPRDLEESARYLAEEIMFGVSEVHTGTLVAAVYPFAETFAGKTGDAKQPGGLESKETVLARAIQGQLTAALADYRRIRLLDRDFKSVLKEHNIQQSGNFDQSTIVAYGGFVGAQGVITGEILNLVSRVQVTVKVIDAKTSETIASASATIDADLIDCALLETCGDRRSTSRKPGAQKPGQAPDGIKTRTEAGLEVTLRGCAAAGDTITCKLTAVHRKQGRLNFTLSRYQSVATFPDGEVAVATRAVFGTDESRAGRGVNFVVYELSPGTPTAIVVEFGELPEIPSEIVTLHLEFTKHAMDFRNIPVD